MMSPKKSKIKITICHMKNTLLFKKKDLILGLFLQCKKQLLRMINGRVEFKSGDGL